MADPPRDKIAGSNVDAGLDRTSTTGIPRWGKMSGIILAVVILLIIAVMLLSGRAGHRPDRHTPPSSVTEDHTPPRGGHG
jgi:hypothetical protein